MDQHRPIERAHRGERERAGRGMPQGLRQKPRGRRSDNPGKKQEQYECRAPTEQGLQRAADHGRHDRRKAGDRAHQRQFAAGAHAGIEVAHHGARQHDGAGAAQRLQKSHRDQPVDRLRRGAADAGEAVEHERREQKRPAAEAIRKRVIKNLADRKAEQITRNAQLHLQYRCVQLPADIG